MFDIQDFDLLIRHSIEKLLRDAPTQDKLEVHLGKETISVQIARVTNSMIEPSLDSEPTEEVKGILLVDSPESLLEKDVEEFIKEDDEPAEPVYIYPSSRLPLDLRLSLSLFPLAPRKLFSTTIEIQL